MLSSIQFGTQHTTKREQRKLNDTFLSLHKVMKLLADYCSNLYITLGKI